MYENLYKQLAYGTLVGVCVALPLYSLYRFHKLSKKWFSELEDEKCFWDRHNCVVMVSPNEDHRITGWPGQLPITSNCGVEEVCAPLVYFLNTAKNTVDLAVMSISNRTLASALIAAHKRGVKIRLLVDFHNTRDNMVFYRLKKQGIPVLQYVRANQSLGSIMHHKYMVKDVESAEENGFLCYGSMNLTDRALLSTYDNVVFTTDFCIVKQFKDNFETLWSHISHQNETNKYIRTVLKLSKVA